MRRNTPGALLATAMVSFLLVTAAKAEEKLNVTKATTTSYSVAPEGEADAGLECYDPCYSAPSWTVKVGAVIFNRSREGNYVLLQDAISSPVFNISDADMGWGVGPRLDTIRHTDGAFDLELDWFSIDSWGDGASGTGTPVFVPAIGAPGWSTYSATYASELQSLEFNLRQERGSWLTVLAGFRYLELDEGLGASLTDPIAPNANPLTATIGAQNRLYGFQLGAEAALWNRSGPLRIDGMLKAGIYQNDASGSAHVVYGALDQTVNLSRDHTAFVGELGLTGTLQLTERLSAYAGYQLMFVEGVALGAEQFTALEAAFVAGTSALDVSGSPFYHGAVFGLQADF